MIIRGLLLLTALAPIIGINLAYWIGVQYASLPECIPYIDGCTSISSTGRYPPGDRLFRAVMLPQAVLLTVTWYLTALWLRAQQPDVRHITTILVGGIGGAAALILYVSYLASNDPFYEIMRRSGIYFYFVLTALAQIVTTLSMGRSRLRSVMLFIMAMPFVLGFYNFFQKAMLGNRGDLENSIEWIVSLLMQVWFICLWLAWRRSRFELVAKTG
ncbi:MAG: hypothetical protein KJO56_02495 [Gammaproteobacteria bacterium]|nr:hypothetical protein [Gammaproteobacteria bacterium]MBT8105110.1 hypothetical protein [Gammaproteobacteria bacterium]NNF48668.1 hypothetical protein [Woeseiaceae bacterium]NNK25124.1 hypothetical protein [Woeseiaceae bacterium]NNL62329.1 hypothetical protein [Woeseiaceae bacterium]